MDDGKSWKGDLGLSDVCLLGSTSLGWCFSMYVEVKAAQRHSEYFDPGSVEYLQPMKVRTTCQKTPHFHNIWSLSLVRRHHASDQTPDLLTSYHHPDLPTNEGVSNKNYHV
jgi:hypothetical protein